MITVTLAPSYAMAYHWACTHLTDRRQWRHVSQYPQMLSLAGPDLRVVLFDGWWSGWSMEDRAAVRARLEVLEAQGATLWTVP